MTALPPRRRSALYLPASNPRAIDKARTLPCDIVILDLEDAVAPDRKAAARDAAIAAVTAGGFGERALIIRVNALDTPWGADDLAAVATLPAPTVLLPKVNDPADLHACAAHLSGCDARLWAMIETARSLFRLDSLAATSTALPLAGFVIGTNDLANELGAALTVTRDPFIGFLMQAVAAARAYGLAILDGVHNDFDDDAGLAAQAAQGAAMGFDGKTLIHPRQIAACNAAFTPDAEAVARARAIVAAFAAPEAAAKGALSIDGRMVERLHLAQARRTLAAAALD